MIWNLNITVSTTLKYCHKRALNKKLKLMGRVMKYFSKKLQGRGIFRSMVPWATNFFLINRYIFAKYRFAKCRLRFAKYRHIILPSKYSVGLQEVFKVCLEDAFKTSLVYQFFVFQDFFKTFSNFITTSWKISWTLTTSCCKRIKYPCLQTGNIPSKKIISFTGMSLKTMGQSGIRKVILPRHNYSSISKSISKTIMNCRNIEKKIKQYMVKGNIISSLNLLSCQNWQKV